MADPIIASYFTNHEEANFVLYMCMGLSTADIL